MYFITCKKKCIFRSQNLKLFSLVRGLELSLYCIGNIPDIFPGCNFKCMFPKCACGIFVSLLLSLCFISAWDCAFGMTHVVVFYEETKEIQDILIYARIWSQFCKGHGYHTADSETMLYLTFSQHSGLFKQCLLWYMALLKKNLLK